MPFFGFRLANRVGGLLVCIALSPLAVAMPAAAQDSVQTLQGSGQPGQTTLSMVTREVLLDVSVSDKSGQPITGLTAADFTVTEEGDAQRLRHLEEHHPMDADALARLKSAPALPPNTFTNFLPVENTNASTVILLDALDTRIQSQMELREQLIDCLKHLQPGTPVAIFQMDVAMHLIQGFTTDPAALWDAARSKRDMPELQKLFRGSADEYRREKLGILHSGFQLMGRYLAGFPGRKSLIWLTGSIPKAYLSDPLGSDVGKSFKDDFSLMGDDPDDLVDALTLSRVVVYPIDVRGLQTPQYSAANNHTMAYATTNQKWTGQFRHIRITVNRPGLQLQYRRGYYAIDRARQEQRFLEAMQRRKGRAGNDPFGDNDAANRGAGAVAAPGDGALTKPRRGGFAATMELGAIPPTEVIFKAKLAIDDKVVKLDKNAPLPADNYLEADYRGKPFRTYELQIVADAHALRMTKTANGMRHGTVEFVTLVYDPQGRRVNSLTTTALLNVTEAHYLRLLQDGFPVKQEIAVPVKGNYFLRVGVHDVPSDHIGALEIPVDEVHSGVAGE